MNFPLLKIKYYKIKEKFHLSTQSENTDFLLVVDEAEASIPEVMETLEKLCIAINVNQHKAEICIKPANVQISYKAIDASRRKKFIVLFTSDIKDYTEVMIQQDSNISIITTVKVTHLNHDAGKKAKSDLWKNIQVYLK